MKVLLYDKEALLFTYHGLTLMDVMVFQRIDKFTYKGATYKTKGTSFDIMGATLTIHCKQTKKKKANDVSASQ